MRQHDDLSDCDGALFRRERLAHLAERDGYFRLALGCGGSGFLICFYFASPFGQPAAGYLPWVGSTERDGYFMEALGFGGWVINASN